MRFPFPSRFAHPLAVGLAALALFGASVQPVAARVLPMAGRFAAYREAA